MEVEIRELRLRGTPISRGVAIGTSFLLHNVEYSVSVYSITEHEITSEIQRYQRALIRSKQEIQFLQKQFEQDRTAEAAEILDTHVQMLHDPFLTSAVEEQIRLHQKNVEFVFQAVIKEYQDKFHNMEDPFFRERYRDIQDISKRILSHLREGTRISLTDTPNNCVVCARELTPSDVAEAKIGYVNAFISEMGGTTSHAAIMARAKGIPYIANVPFNLLKQIKDCFLIVDGCSGEIIINPSEETLTKYREQQKQLNHLMIELEREGSFPIETFDGYNIKLFANVEMVQDVELVHRYGCNGVGLFRSEYILVPQNGYPNEEEQFLIYKSLVTKMNGLPITIRTFDIGGDKYHQFHELQNEINPLLGCRAIRFLLKEKHLFKTQLRAILRSSYFGNLSILFPMISNLSELIESKRLLNEAKEELEKEGKNVSDSIRIGSMIEVPSAAIISDFIAKECDFLSIGTNDLIQYSLAVDRSNQSLHKLYNPTHPSILRLIRWIVRSAHQSKIPVVLCGEMAADPRFTALLLGLGIHEFSVTARYLPVIKNAIRNTSIVEATQLAEKALMLDNSDAIESLIFEEHRKKMQSDFIHSHF